MDKFEAISSKDKKLCPHYNKNNSKTSKREHLVMFQFKTSEK